MKKLIVFLVIVTGLFIALMVVTEIQNKQAAAGNPFGKETLHPLTVEQLDDPLYGNQILPDELQEKLANKEDLYVYFYSPECVHCRETTPVLVPVAEELDIDLKKHNLLEFPDSWEEYKIEGTPTLVYYKDGQEARRIAGAQTADAYKTFFRQTKGQ